METFQAISQLILLQSTVCQALPWHLGPLGSHKDPALKLNLERQALRYLEDQGSTPQSSQVVGMGARVQNSGPAFFPSSPAQGRHELSDPACQPTGWVGGAHAHWSPH